MARMKMLSGFNHNLTHKKRVFHIQTEDTGRDTHHIITHAFIAGIILDTVRSDYGDLLAVENWVDPVRERMKAQHLDEIKKLYSGLFDDTAEELSPL